VEISLSGRERALSPTQTSELARLVARIEGHFGAPCDVEWALVDNAFCILQSRPITTLSTATLQPQTDVFDLHFRQSDFPFLFASATFKGNRYGRFDYLVLQEGDTCTAYLSELGVCQAYDYGKRLLDTEKAFAILSRLETILIRLKSIRLEFSAIPEHDLPSKWNLAEKICDDLLEVYMYCEHPVLAPLENVLSVRFGSTERLLQALHDPSKYIQDDHPSEDTLLFYRLIRFGELKFAIHAEMPTLFEIIHSICSQIAEQRGVHPDLICSYSVDEITALLETGSAPTELIVTQRQTGVAFYPARSETSKHISGVEYLELKRRLEPEGADMVSGTSGSRGRASGTVKIHLSGVRSIVIPPGTVLVSGMTNPQMAPYLTNAVALITDEGGLTSHAAILSRELGIPSVIGTKCATQVFQDGDLVEVDGNTGTVRLLLRNQ
jgi:phosphohistidine swiveling domain-containing protein